MRVSPMAPMLNHPDATPSARRLPLVRARVPRPLLAAVEASARVSGQSLSAALRELLTAALTQRGEWPPRAATRPATAPVRRRDAESARVG